MLAASSVRAQAPASPAAAARTPADTLAWLTGCWRLTTPQSVTEEQWMSPSGGVMLGVSRTVAGGRVRSFEFLRIFSSGDTLVYAALPSGQKYTEFRARSVSPTEIVFENPSHDFPQRVGYRRTSTDSVVAFIEGERNGQTRRIPFAYVRVKCG
jgi:hypothetical protein